MRRDVRYYGMGYVKYCSTLYEGDDTLCYDDFKSTTLDEDYEFMITTEICEGAQECTMWGGNYYGAGVCDWSGG